MTVYAVSNGIYSTSKQHDDSRTWALDHAAKLERRLELGRHIDGAAQQWLHKPSQLPRLAFWLELLHRADVDGVCDLSTLATWQLFDTWRKRDYLLRMLERYGLVTRLDSQRVQVTA